MSGPQFSFNFITRPPQSPVHIMFTRCPVKLDAQAMSKGLHYVVNQAKQHRRRGPNKSNQLQHNKSMTERGLSMLASPISIQSANNQFINAVTSTWPNVDLDMQQRLQDASKPPPTSNSFAPLALHDLVRVIEEEIQLHDGPITLEKKDAIHHALAAFDGNMNDLQPFINFDRTRNYTRNLVVTDNVSYSLIVLCWNKGKYSPIHDHPSDGCWIRHIQGIVNEVRYESDGEALVESANALISHGVSYMDDSLGLHKVGNPSEDVDAITLHLYAPPFDQCRLWHDPQDATNATTAIATYDTMFGNRPV
ncbi:hypothetical protein DYB26_016011 [Aphanomyces astaci]|uniref:Cysteine dioxygenase n=1 Tax=Aphanomyces astaci TaxID=112090 RepID=A0A397ELT4_APHAT|nr:hypothetical protein DYB38_012749 [Aphanomyces astaci]RHY98615.1 hypothetical protein DYB31_015075 [Aphanomyces astaci]RHZ15178.1 hypothetical protein DYB26_016011 [Aphanomyces astaci]